MTPHEARKVRFRRPSVRAACALALVLLAPAAAGLPQSPCQAQWEPTFGVSPDLVYETRVLTVLDDGNGPALYAGGPIESAGGVPANGIAKWDGTRWSALGSGVGVGEVKAVAVYDDGSGPAIYVAGTFASAGGLSASNIAKWDGASWSALGSGTDGVVHALCVYDDGSGPALYAGGEFSTAGGVFSPRIARWNGATWSALGSGISPTIGTLVRSLQVFDDGAGLALFVGGVFFHAGGLSTNYVARWNGAWAALGTGTNGQVLSMLVFDDGSGPALCLSGAFTVAGGSSCIGIARWTAAGWTTLGSIPTSGVASALAVYDQGTGPSLYAVTGDMFGPKVTRWDGSSWSLLPISVGLGILGQSPAISALASFHVGGQQVLFFGGKFFDAGSLRVRALATWDGAQVGTVGPGLAGYVAALASFDDGSGPALVAGGGFFSVGGTPMAGVAKWDGAHWAPFGSGLGYTSVLASFDDGGGAELYAGGMFYLGGGLARWDAGSWSALGTGLSNAPSPFPGVHALAVYDDGGGPALYVGGEFTAAGGVPANNIARWDGTGWSALGSGTGHALPSSGAPRVTSLAVFDDGSGPALYAGGWFETAGGVIVNHVAKWDGSSWSSLGVGTSGPPNSTGVNALFAFDDGQGPALYAGGAITSAGGAPANGIARWDGSSWTPLGTGMQVVDAIASFDDGGGPVLYAGGEFSSAGGVAAAGIAKWSGSSWSALGGGMNPAAVLALLDYDMGDCAGRSLFAGGYFGSATDSGDSYLARWGCPQECSSAFCFGDGSSAGQIACPCANTGTAGRGCDNSVATGGAQLSTSGHTVDDSLTLHSSGELPSVLSIFLQGNVQNPNGVLFGDGVRCVAGNLKRMFAKSAVGGSVSAPLAGDPTIRQQSANFGDPIAPGTRRWYQVYYRDPDAGFCPAPQGNSWNVSSGLEVRW